MPRVFWIMMPLVGTWLAGLPPCDWALVGDKPTVATGGPVAGEPDGAASSEGDEMAASDGPRLAALELRLDENTRQSPWSSLIVWLRPMGASSWDAVTVDRPRGEVGPLLKVELPDALTGRDLEVQAASAGPDGLDGWMILLESERRGYRARVLGHRGREAVLLLARPLRPIATLAVRATDADGRLLADVTVGLRALDTRLPRPLIESRVAATGPDGTATLQLWRRGADKAWLWCMKPGWTTQLRRVVSQGRSEVECWLEPAPEPTGVIEEAGRRPPFGVVRVVDENGGEPIDVGSVRWTWRRGDTAVEAVGFGHGLWGVPTPDPIPERAEIEIDAPCYEPVSGLLSPLGGRRVALSYVCKTAKLSIRLVGAGPGLVIQNPEQATATVRQGARETTLAFSTDGYSEAKGFRFDPTGGPVEIEVRAPGYGVASRTIDNFAEQIDENGYVPDLEIALRPAGRGLAVLLNAAETWAFYPPARDVVIRALGTSGESAEAPDHLLVGVLGGAHDRAAFDDPGQLGDVLRWLRGMSASGGRLLAENLGQRLDRLSSTWPTASGWDLVVVVPHDPLAGTTSEPVEPDEHVAAARAWLDALGAQRVVLHVIEDGGTNPALRAFAEHLGGRHVEIDSATDPQTARDAIREHLAAVSTAPGGE